MGRCEIEACHGHAATRRGRTLSTYNCSCLHCPRDGETGDTGSYWVLGVKEKDKSRMFFRILFLDLSQQ